MTDWLTPEALMLLLGGAGGAAMALHVWHQRGRRKLDRARLIVSALTGTLAGWTFARFGRSLGLDEDTRYVMAACGGAGGMEVMRRLLDHLLTRTTGGRK